MKLQYASFLVPLYAESSEQELLNRFIRGHRIVQSHKELVTVNGTPQWAVLVEYLDNVEKAANEAQGKSKVDYKEQLSPEDFSLFSKLREVRKKLAEESGLPVYAVCNNEQFAEMARSKPRTLTDCMKIDGIGQGKADKYAPSFLECITDNAAANEEPDIF